ncbi:MAG: hypothetical protein NHF86_00735 [Candidatus Bostrichicola ureolyticus]|nr:MAG: hypothetical protein NHF86_00735 [Candidatus Bostrichicola ureolyticus]
MLFLFCKLFVTKYLSTYVISFSNSHLYLSERHPTNLSIIPFLYKF